MSIIINPIYEKISTTYLPKNKDLVQTKQIYKLTNKVFISSEYPKSLSKFKKNPNNENNT